MLVHQSFGLAGIQILEDEWKETGEREGSGGFLGPTRQVPEDSPVIVPAFGLEGLANARRTFGELVRLVGRVARDRHELRKAPPTVRVYGVHADVLPRERAARRS